MNLRPGQRIRVRQRISRREGDWSVDVTGDVVDVCQEPTGSWFVHGLNHKLWLARIRLRKPDGELTTVNVDPASQIEILADAPADA